MSAASLGYPASDIAAPRTAAASSTRASVNDAVLGMRGAAVLLIGITHYLPAQLFSFNIARPLSSFMFVATGYFWAVQVSKSQGLTDPRLAIRAHTLWNLMIQRHARIWPVLAVTILGYIAIGLADGGELTGQILRTWPLYLAYLGNVPKYLYEGQAFPSHFWLISSQEQVILTVGVAIVLMGYARLSRLLMPMLLLGIVSRSVGAVLFMPDHTAIALDSPLAIIDSLAIGFLLQAALSRRADRTRLRRQLGTFGVLALMVWATLPNLNAVYFGIMPFIAAIWGAFFLAIVTDTLRLPGIASSLISSRFLVHCGKIALSLYMVHPLINTILILCYPMVVGDTIPWPLFVAVGPIAAFAVANLMFITVESPAQDLRHAIRTAHTAEVRV